MEKFLNKNRYKPLIEHLATSAVAMALRLLAVWRNVHIVISFPFILYKYRTNPCQHKAPGRSPCLCQTHQLLYPIHFESVTVNNIFVPHCRYSSLSLSQLTHFNHRLVGDSIDNYSSECLFFAFLFYAHTYYVSIWTRTDTPFTGDR